MLLTPFQIPVWCNPQSKQTLGNENVRYNVSFGEVLHLFWSHTHKGKLAHGKWALLEGKASKKFKPRTEWLHRKYLSHLLTYYSTNK
jgi:hypothetical protein